MTAPRPDHLVDTAILSALTGRPPAAVRAHCTRSPTGYDPAAAAAELAAAPDPILYTAAQASHNLGIRAGTIRSRASRGQLRALDHDEYGHPRYALTDLEQLPRG